MNNTGQREKWILYYCLQVYYGGSHHATDYIHVHVNSPDAGSGLPVPDADGLVIRRTDNPRVLLAEREHGITVTPAGLTNRGTTKTRRVPLYNIETS